MPSKVKLYNQSRQGSALTAVIIITMIVGIIVASIMQGTVTEMKVNNRYISRLKAKSAAESAVEYGAAELAYRFENQSAFPSDELSVGNKPLSIPSSVTTFMQGSDIDGSSMEIKGGVIPPGEWMYFDSDDPSNEFDPMRGRRAYVREIELYGKGVARASNRDDIHAYATELFQVRDAPLFANAIFYNSDLEINPGVDMDIYGPVHTNGDLYVGAKSSADLKFHDKVTSTGDIIHGEKWPVHISDGSNVYFPSALDPEISRSMRVDSAILDSTDSAWKEEASERWNGYIQDGSMGVGEQNMVAFDEYESDDYSTATEETDNSGYALIEPLLPNSHADRKSTELRTQKMSYKAGLLLRVESDPSASVGDDDYYVIKAYKYERSNTDDPLSDPVLDGNGDPTLIAVTFPENIIGDPDADFGYIESPNIERYSESTATLTESVTTTTGRGRNRTTTTTEVESEVTNVQSGLYDHREDLGINTFALDIGKLKSYVDSNDNSASGFDNTYDVSKDWNGIVYVEFPTSSATETDGSFQYGASSGQNTYGIVPSAYNDLALLVMDAREIPEPSGMSQDGFTLTTNAPMYVVGSFNADGTSHTSDATEVDDANEKPAALIADTITVLSDNWKNNRGYSAYDGRTKVENNRPANSYVEISAALVSGTPNTVPSGSTYGDNTQPLSLGVVNLPRFLENWTGQTLTIRGSLVSLYESEVRPLGAPTNFNDFYTPPIRDWGFSSLFSSGSYPPGTPLIRTYRRLMFEEIDKTTYDAAVAGL